MISGEVFRRGRFYEFSGLFLGIDILESSSEGLSVRGLGTEKTTELDLLSPQKKVVLNL